MILNKNDTVLLIALSNQLDKKNAFIIDELTSALTSLGLNVVISSNLFKIDKYTSKPELRANEFNDFLANNTVNAIFDVSGGDLANELLPFINIDYINSFNGIYIGYSDLSVILNLFIKYNKKAIYYNIKTLINDNQIDYFNSRFIQCKYNYFNDIKFKFLNGKYLKGKIVGGNIRCVLKLAGTNYFPNFKNKILFLESFSGDLNKIRTYIAQYAALGCFKDASGILIGQFTEVDDSLDRDDLRAIFKEVACSYNIPLVETLDIGHSSNSKALVLNQYIDIKIR